MQISSDSAIQWEQTPTLCEVVQRVSGAADANVSLRRGRFVSGAADGVEVIQIDTGAICVWVLPTRGMGIWKIQAGEQTLGWKSPVEGPVHPALVPIHDDSGIGWLEGFDELLVRCGLESNGAPEWDADGKLIYPLHGRIANLPAGNLKVEFDAESGRLTLSGQVNESRLFFKNLQLESCLTVTAGQSQVQVEDRVTNRMSQPAKTQMLYHINVGVPLLSAGAKVRIASTDVTGKDATSQAEIEQWNQVGPPVSGYGERVYFIAPEATGDWSAALLQSADSQQGLGVAFDTTTLPHLVMWKNTAAVEDGYVVGLEPATNLPNQRSQEEAAGRIVSLEPGGTVVYRLSLNVLQSATEVEGFASQHRLL
ncbi:hypothetical protein FF011L_39510 [Roseimaritima multifibrata]|uniref:DUF4432 domain-containing protein n=1 Tax=Roseimaritima multifibrata TaxID=1930274 RepID=A0A517MJX1_9BACT|nr:aldose 1-epimerase family protein [Roseimaritima multifibrata]QDS95164.1 hypothetical protein FF011L_39510 [Roseimaritima multifibrata]